MTHPPTLESHPICPTCQSDLTGREELKRFAGEELDVPPTANDLLLFCEETSRLIHFLGALAQAAPHAVADYAREVRDTPDWTLTLSSVAEELAQEAERRLLLLRDAGRIWKARAEGAPAGGKEG